MCGRHSMSTRLDGCVWAGKLPQRAVVLGDVEHDLNYAYDQRNHQPDTHVPFPGPEVIAWVAGWIPGGHGLEDHLGVVLDEMLLPLRRVFRPVPPVLFELGT